MVVSQARCFPTRLDDPTSVHYRSDSAAVQPIAPGTSEQLSADAFGSPSAERQASIGGTASGAWGARANEAIAWGHTPYQTLIDQFGREDPAIMLWYAGYPFQAPTKELTDGSLTAGSGWRVNEELSGVIHLDAVKLRDGREYGPLEVGYYRSQPVTYPLDIPFFKHLCENDHLVPANFEDRSEQHRFLGDEIIHRPEPQILDAIHQTIACQMVAHRMKPMPVWSDRDNRRMNHVSSLEEGEDLWPPVQVLQDKGGLGVNKDVPRQNLPNRITRLLPARRGRTHSTLFHLGVATTAGERHILMVPAHSWWRDVMTEREPQNSQLWLFFEGVIGQHLGGDGYRLAYLGAMGLPREATRVLYDSGTIRAALPMLLHGRR